MHLVSEALKGYHLKVSGDYLTCCDTIPGLARSIPDIVFNPAQEHTSSELMKFERRM